MFSHVNHLTELEASYLFRPDLSCRYAKSLEQKQNAAGPEYFKLSTRMREVALKL
jgi:hypothetical protein